MPLLALCFQNLRSVPAHVSQTLWGSCWTGPAHGSLTGGVVSGVYWMLPARQWS